VIARFRVFFLVLVFLQSVCSAQDADWLRMFSAELGRIERGIRTDKEMLTRLGVGVLSQTTDELGYQHRQMMEPPPVPPWIQIDLGDARRIDWIVLVPALVDWQQDRSAPYAFPPRFRLDVSDDPAFGTFTPVAIFGDDDSPPG